MLNEIQNTDNSSKMHHLKALTTPPKPVRFDYSGRLSERKRALFPSQIQDSDDSDIGHMSPLEYSSSPEPYKSVNQGSSPELQPIEDSDECLGRFSPDFVHLNLQDQENIDPKTSPQLKINEPKSPTTEILKTPHDSATNIKLPRLVRKSLIDITNIDLTSLKRKSESPIESSANKTIKFDHQAKSKARTALFPESIFPAKSFYPKTELKLPIVHIDLTQKPQKLPKKLNPIYLCNRSKHQTKNGLINAGVRHKIKKPRLKPALTKTQLLKAALNIVKNSPLNDYFDSLQTNENECGVSFEQIQKMDSILKNLDRKPFQSEAETDTKCGIKRCLSPEPDQKKKFFKSGHSRAIVTISNKIKFQVDHGEFSLIESKKRRPKVNFEETLKIDDILKTLEQQEPPKIKPELGLNLNKNMLLSPTSLVCDLTSGLALDSPKNNPVSIPLLDKLSHLKKRISFPETMDPPQQKLFPIFCGKQNEPKPQQHKENKHVKNIRKIWKPLSEDQTLIDAGQKKFGLTQCPDCKFAYSLGEPEDEIMHFQHHNSVGVLRYNCWKHERIVNHFSNGKVLQVNPNDPKSWLKKVKDVMEVINRELGFVDIPFDMFNKKVFLCIINKQIVGCLVAEVKSHAHKMLPNLGGIDVCTEETFPAKCGISRLWVSMTHRKKGVATCLMNAMRSNFMYGHILAAHEIAFSSPTEDGKKFAQKYMKTEEFLIYTS